MQAGIVGKPNVGKSTFFSAATLMTVEISNRTFTTIKPNRGVGYVRTPCVCKEFAVQDHPVNSACLDGVRMVPVDLIDCAGLVPGAWQGRGLGNQFLDEIRRADALIHIVDASGGTDEEGRIQAPGSRDPLDDVEFLENEISMWLTQLIMKDWPKMKQRVKVEDEDLVSLMEGRLSGLSIRKPHLQMALQKARLDADKPDEWSGHDLEEFAKELLRISKPMLIAANKIDLPSAEENLDRMRAAGYTVIPCCAEAELALRRAAEKRLIDYRPGDCSFNIPKPKALTADQLTALNIVKERILTAFGSTGVQEAINYAFFQLLGVIAVYPVEDLDKLADHKGRVLPDVYLVPYGTTSKQLASMVHTELGEGFIYAVEARGKRRVGEDYVLKDRDVIRFVSAKSRG